MRYISGIWLVVVYPRTLDDFSANFFLEYIDSLPLLANTLATEVE